MRTCYCGIRFFFENVLKRNWHILGILRAQNERRLPAVLSVGEVRSLLARVKTPQNHVFLTTVYSCGLRLQQGLQLEVSDIDSDRMMIHMHRGKGAKDRYVPQAMQAICDCRTEACGTALYRCEQCGESHLVKRSCGNRHCPTCQHHKTRQWLERQMERQLHRDRPCCTTA